jgi:hypothetical protein
VLAAFAENLFQNTSLDRHGGGMQRPGWRETIVYGGLTAGLLDACDAVLFFGSRGASPDRIAQSVASGLLGEASAGGGAAVIVLGVLLHFTVATCIAAVFYLLATQIPALLRHPVVGGLGFGVVAYFVMSYLVVPLSRASTFDTIKLHPFPVLVNGVVGHALLIGLPIGLWAARSVRTRSSRFRASPGAEPPDADHGGGRVPLKS